ncbi:hypothetical protein CVD25_14310 [Bacillus canaveralius]|uniref:Uncharacterized protein n=1 Tax=Bacillus canaveralius TaxID=1403243 RepID=A0A2N5GLK6_9BACI|nr:CBO0543 family protein [Bacillus canaveralius]PLR82514.1 hypothetical protein CU635_11975 [Bacillus canaveralius]PLR95685.1 hypothetical protein CVD25_14310 [Bacillus canaveralius]RSK45585.1 hypothetical protein EJA13_19365 [Bacillus canaveralius]
MAHNVEYKKIQEYQDVIDAMGKVYFADYSLFEPHWWFLLAATFIPWIVWWKIVDRGRLLEILLHGLLWSSIASLLDELGSTFGFWEYPKGLVPIKHTLISADIGVIPVAYMIIYQFFPNNWPFFFANLGLAFVFSFIIEPIFMHYDLLKLNIGWSHFTSLIVFSVLGLSIRWLTRLIIKKAK